METRFEARYDPTSKLFAGLVQNTKGPRDSSWPIILNTLINSKGIPILPQISENDEVQVPLGKLLIANLGKMKWETITDNRGTWYNKETGEIVAISDSNIDTDTSNLTMFQPDCPFPKWDESSLKWIVDIERQQEYEQISWRNQLPTLKKLPGTEARQLLYSQLRYYLGGKSINSDMDFKKPLIILDEKTMSVDEANVLWLYYMAESNTEKASSIQESIISAKLYIRTLIK